MNAREAMVYAARDGLKVRKSCWPDWKWAHFDDQGDFKTCSDEHLLEYFNDCWEIYQEPPKEYTFLELFDMLKEDEYAEPVDKDQGWLLQGIKPDGGLYTLNEDMTEFNGPVAMYKDDYKIKYIIKKKPSPPVKEKEGCECGRCGLRWCECCCHLGT